MPLSMQQTWSETVSFVRRESSLLIPLSLSTLALGQAGLVMVITEIRSGAAGGGLPLLIFGCWLLVTLGQLAISALVLMPGSSVGEALRRGASNLPKMAIIVVWTVMIAVLIAAPLTLLLQKGGLDPNNAAQSLRPQDLLILSPVVILAIWFSVRTLVLHAVLIDKKRSALGSLIDSFKLTKGRTGALLPVVMLFFVIGQLIQMVVALVASLLLTSIMTMLGAPVVGVALASLVAGAAAAAPSAYQSVFSALLYRKLG